MIAGPEIGQITQSGLALLKAQHVNPGSAFFAGKPGLRKFLFELFMLQPALRVSFVGKAGYNNAVFGTVLRRDFVGRVGCFGN